MSEIRMILAQDLFDVQVTIIGSRREPPPDASGDFMAGTVCAVWGFFRDNQILIEIPFAEGEIARFPVHMNYLQPG